MRPEPETAPLWQGGWLQSARRVASPNFGPRPVGADIDLIVLHSISLPPGVYGGPEVEQLFTNRLDWDAHPYFQQIRGMEVSSHFFIRRCGELMQFVDADARAWHAGRSAWRGRENCNDDSIGIELEGLEGDTFEPAQYRTLHDLCQEPDALSHPQGTQIRVSRQELARIVGCSREMAGRVLKQLQEQGLLHARGKTIVVYGTR